MQYIFGFITLKVGDVIIVDNRKQISAELLKKIRQNSGEITLLPSSNNIWKSNTKEYQTNVIDDEVILAGRARYANLKYFNGKFISSNNVIFYKNNNYINMKYIYYIFQIVIEKFYMEKGTYPTLDVQNFLNLQIQIPSLSIQKKVVEILDKFDFLINDLSNGLPAEIDARQKQYEYYRDLLLDFGKNN